MSKKIIITHCTQCPHCKIPCDTKIREIPKESPFACFAVDPTKFISNVDYYHNRNTTPDYCPLEDE